MSLFDTSFFKRLGFFLFGLSIGLVFLAFFLKKKTELTGVYFCYLPNCRVLKDMRSKPIEYSDRILEMLKNKDLDTLELNSFFVDGDVNFSSSDTEAKPCKKYLVEQEIGGVLVTMFVDNCATKVIVTDLH